MGLPVDEDFVPAALARSSVPARLARNCAADCHVRPWLSVVRARTVTSPPGGSPLTVTWIGVTNAATAAAASNRACSGAAFPLLAHSRARSLSRWCESGFGSTYA
jgi:hypothetical protein